MCFFIRIECNHQIGMGHYARMTNLMESMNEDAIYLVTKESNAFQSKVKEDVLVIEDEVNDVITNAEKYQPKAIIYDLLNYSNIEFSKIKDKLNVPVIAFHEKNHWVNPEILNINYNTFEGWEDMTDTGLFGPKYIIFNPKINKASKKTDEKLFVSFGGSDPNNIMRWFIENILPKVSFKKIMLHFGPLASYLNEYSNIENSMVGIYRAPVNLHEVSQSCSRALVAGGNTMYEMVYQGLTTLVIAQNSHQEEFARNADRHSLLKYLGGYPELDENEVIKELNNSYSFNQNNLIDGHGSKRIGNKIKTLI